MNIPGHPDYIKRLVPEEVWVEVGNVIVNRMHTVTTHQQMNEPIYPHYVCGAPENVTTWTIMALHAMSEEARLELAKALLPGYDISKAPAA